MQQREEQIYQDRKELKKMAHKVVRSHYVALTFFMLIMVFFGTEFYQNLSGTRGLAALRGEGVTAGTVYSFFDQGGVLSDILSGKLTAGAEKASERETQIEEEGDISQALGRTNGILAQVVNSISSGQIFVSIAAPLKRITNSDKAVGIIFFSAILLFYALYYIFIKNVYSAVLRRVFLGARVYEKFGAEDVLHFFAVKKWFKACMAMLWQTLLQLLWSLTVVGGFIKYYSYFCVPFIVAENPGVGARDAVNLSRRMMDGHKLEVFKLQLSLAVWIILGFLTLGISDILYGASYRMACYAEVYARLRAEALEKGIEGTQVLDDTYLYEKASRVELAEVYFDVVDEITLLHEGKMELGPVRRFISTWFGVWLGSQESKQQYDDIEGRQHAIVRLNASMTGKSYPDWLNPRWLHRKLEKKDNFSPFRNYTVWTVFLLFLSFSCIGWIWEVLLHLVQTGQFANRGTLHGPWLPIYGSGGVIVLLLCNRFRKKPVVEFTVATLLCGGLEYYISWYLENTYHERWWSYDGYFLNLNGRICAEGLLVFGIGCCIVVYAVAPMFDYILSKVKTRVLIPICLVLGVCYGADAVYSAKHPNMAEGAIEAREPEEEESRAETETEAEEEESSTISGEEAKDLEVLLKLEQVQRLLQYSEVQELGEVVLKRLTSLGDVDPALVEKILDKLGINEDFVFDEEVLHRVERLLEGIQ